MRRTLLPALLMALLAACGAANDVTIRTDGMRFVSDEVRVKAGQPVTLRVVNQLSLIHISEPTRPY